MTHRQKVRQALDRCSEEANRCFADLAKNLDVSNPDHALMRTYINETFDETMRQIFDLIRDQNTLEKAMSLIGDAIAKMVYQLPAASVVDAALGQLVAVSLFGRVAFWKSEYSKRQRELSQATKRTVGPQTEPLRRKEQLEVIYPKRADWLKARLRERGWSASDLNGRGGPDKNTVLKVSRGLSVTNNSLSKLATALSWDTRFRPIAVSDIPDA